MTGYSDVLIGLQIGDEGKGRIIDSIAQGYDVIGRYNGGPNAGHTVEANGKKLVLHGIPSGVFHQNSILYVGSGCVINIEKLIAELEDVRNAGIDLTGRLYISDRTTVIQPHHIALDEIVGKNLGTTANGIGPAYADRALRSNGTVLKNLHLGDLIAMPEEARRTIEQNYEEFCKNYNFEGDIRPAAERIINLAQQLQKYVCTDRLFLTKLVSAGKNILFEGAQSAALDVNHGTVPYVTSSHTGAGAAYTGGDLAPTYHRKTVGVAKAIMSRVGHGPFVSEFGGKRSEDYCMEENGKKHTRELEKHYDLNALIKSSDLFDIGIALRILGNEYGATTGRPRRIGMLDFVQLKEMCQYNGVNEMHLTKLDMLADFTRTALPGIPIVSQYILDGASIDFTPAAQANHRRVQSSIDYLPLMLSTRDVRSFEDLPPEAKEFIKCLEKFLDIPVRGIGVGPEREQFILKS